MFFAGDCLKFAIYIWTDNNDDNNSRIVTAGRRAAHLGSNTGYLSFGHAQRWPLRTVQR